MVTRLCGDGAVPRSNFLHESCVAHERCVARETRQAAPRHKILMRFRYLTRFWRLAGFCGLLCLGGQRDAVAQSDAASLPAKPAQTSAMTKTTRTATTRTSAKAKRHRTANAATSRATATSSKTSRGKKGKKRGQQAIDATRARQIQTALIRERYMQGEPTGTWDSTSQAAMRKFQADQGWQSKQIPDSRALIKLGLGPSHDHLLNPESAMTTASPAAAADSKAPAKPTPAKDNVPKQ